MPDTITTETTRIMQRLLTSLQTLKHRDTCFTQPCTCGLTMLLDGCAKYFVLTPDN
jgi:hypothetical protein